MPSTEQLVPGLVLECRVSMSSEQKSWLGGYRMQSEVAGLGDSCHTLKVIEQASRKGQLGLECRQPGWQPKERLARRA